MTKISQKQEHLAKAENAQQEADKAISPDMRDSWLKVAQGYRRLAAGSGEIFKP